MLQANTGTWFQKLNLLNKRTAVYSLFFLLFFFLSCSLGAAGDRPGFKILIWPFQTDVLKDYELYREIGIGGFQIDRGAGQYERINLSIEKDFPCYAGHVADKGYLYLKGKNKALVTGKKDLIKRPISLADPGVIKEIKAYIQKNILDLKKGNVIAYALDDEISLGTFTNPSDVDISSFSLGEFRKWLELNYTGIEDLNTQWNSRFKSFSEVMPQGFERVRKSLSAKHFSNWNLSPWMDFRHFMDIQFSQVLSELVAYSNSIDPDTPAGFAGGLSPSVWGGYDYGLLARAVQWMEAYDIHGSNEILRSFWKYSKNIRMQTFFSSGNMKKDSWFLWYYMLHGNQAAIGWPEGWFEKIDGKRQPSEYIRSLKRVFEAVQGEASEYIVNKNSIFSPDPIGIYYSHPSIQAGWAMDALVHGKTWPQRLSSIDNENQSSGVLRKVWCKSLEDLGYQYDFINYLDVIESKIDLNLLFKVIILPKTICLSQTEADAFKQFVENGGVLVADYLCGIFDNHGKYRGKGILDSLFGINRDDTKGYFNRKGVTEIDAEKYTSDFLDRFTFYKGSNYHNNIVIAERGTKPYLYSNRSGIGWTWYLNLSPIEYWSNEKRLSDYGKQWRGIISNILKEAQLFPRVVIEEKGKRFNMIETLFWKNGNDLFLGLVKNQAVAEDGPDIFKARGIEGITGNPTRITIHFKTEKAVFDVKNQKSHGRVKIFSDDFQPWEGSVYKISD